VLDDGVDWVLGQGTSAMLNQLGEMVTALVQWLLDGVVSLSVSILGYFWDAAEPDVGASWFAGSESTPYGQMVVLALPLLAAFFLVGVIQGVLKGDPAGMLRMAAVRLPGACLAMTVTVAITDLLLRATDAMSDVVLAAFRDDITVMSEMIATVAGTPNLAGSAQLLVLVFGVLGLFAAVAVLLELFVRSGLIYIVVALCPFIYAAAVWESMKGAVRKMAEIGLALILSKFVIAPRPCAASRRGRPSVRPG
jgi:hypothetical protein